MDLIYVAGNLEINGPNIQLFYLLKGVAGRVNSVAVVATSSRTDPRVMEFLSSMGCSVFVCGGSGIGSLARAALLVRRLATRSTVMQSYGLRADLIAFLSGARPWLTQVHNNLRFNYLQRFGSVLGRFYYYLNRFLILRADIRVSCSKSVRRNLQSLGIDSVEITNSFDRELFAHFLCGEGSQVASMPRPRYVTVSSNIPGKNVGLVLSSLVAEDQPARSLVVIGPVCSSLVEEYALNSNVVFLGHVKNPGEIISQCDFFISASLHEGMPNAPLEALALGKLVALSSIPPHLDLLESLEFAVGVSFDLDIASIRASLDVLEEGARCKTFCSDPDEVSRRFSAKGMSDSYLRLYNALM